MLIVRKGKRSDAVAEHLGQGNILVSALYYFPFLKSQPPDAAAQPLHPKTSSLNKKLEWLFDISAVVC